MSTDTYTEAARIADLPEVKKTFVDYHENPSHLRRASAIRIVLDAAEAGEATAGEGVAAADERLTFRESREKARKAIEDAIKTAMKDFTTETGVHIRSVTPRIAEHMEYVSAGMRRISDTMLLGVRLTTDADDTEID